MKTKIAKISIRRGSISNERRANAEFFLIRAAASLRARRFSNRASLLIFSQRGPKSGWKRSEIEKERGRMGRRERVNRHAQLPGLGTKLPIRSGSIGPADPPDAIRWIHRAIIYMQITRKRKRRNELASERTSIEACIG